MEIQVNGINSGSMPRHEVKATEEIEKMRLQTEIAVEKQKLKDEENSTENAKEKKQYDPTKFMMSQSDMKELLLMMGSKGDSRTIEKLAELVKKERELSDRNK